MKNLIQVLSDEHLLRDVEITAACERRATAELIALLAEVDARRLYLGQGYSSMFVYCTKSLHLSEHAAYGRIEAARAARKFPVILDRLGDGSITLTSICLLSNHLTEANHLELLDAARNSTRREVEEQIAALHPMAAVPSVIRKLPPTARMGNTIETPILVDSRNATSSCGVPERESALSRVIAPAVIRPLAPERYKIQFTVDRDTHEKLRRVQNLMRHVVPNGDVAVIFGRALTTLLSKLERRKLAQVDRQKRPTIQHATGRHVPAAVTREVWKRDQGQCAFVGIKGRCEERGFLEIHHVIPFAEGGATTSENLQLRCRAHNQHEARARCCHASTD